MELGADWENGSAGHLRLPGQQSGTQGIEKGMREITASAQLAPATAGHGFPHGQHEPAEPACRQLLPSGCQAAQCVSGRMGPPAPSWDVVCRFSYRCSLKWCSPFSIWSLSSLTSCLDPSRASPQPCSTHVFISPVSFILCITCQSKRCTPSGRY